MQVFTYICAILFLHLSNQEGFSVPSFTVESFFVHIFYMFTDNIRSNYVGLDYIIGVITNVKLRF